LPLVEEQSAKVSQWRKRLSPPADLVGKARLECADRLLKRIHDLVECAYGRNPYRMPASEQLKPVYDQAVRDGDAHALATIAALRQFSAGEYSAVLQEMFRFDDAGTRYGFALAIEFLVQLAAPLLRYGEAEAAGT